MSTTEEPCPTCHGPAVNRGEYWETSWNPRPASPDESRRIAHERANRIGLENLRLRRVLRQIATGAAEPHDGFTYEEIARIADEALGTSILTVNGDGK